jgi:hypothetical protein
MTDRNIAGSDFVVVLTLISIIMSGLYFVLPTMTLQYPEEKPENSVWDVFYEFPMNNLNNRIMHESTLSNNETYTYYIDAPIERTGVTRNPGVNYEGPPYDDIYISAFSEDFFSIYALDMKGTVLWHRINVTTVSERAFTISIAGRYTLLIHNPSDKRIEYKISVQSQLTL